MRLWDESKHPRNADGKFRKVGLLEGMGENDVDESEENIVFRKGNLYKDKENVVYNEKSDKEINLSKQEWAIWYSKIGEIKRGYVFRKNKQGNYLIPIENKYGELKIVITKYNYQKPKALEVKKFRDVFDMVDYLEINGEYYD